MRVWRRAHGSVGGDGHPRGARAGRGAVPAARRVPRSPGGGDALADVPTTDPAPDHADDTDVRASDPASHLRDPADPDADIPASHPPDAETTAGSDTAANTPGSDLDADPLADATLARPSVRADSTPHWLQRPHGRVDARPGGAPGRERVPTTVDRSRRHGRAHRPAALHHGSTRHQGRLGRGGRVSAIPEAYAAYASRASSTTGIVRSVSSS